MPGHFARVSPLGNVPELHSDYAFFRDKKGDKVNSVTVLVTKDRKSQGICAHGTQERSRRRFHREAVRPGH